MGIVAACHGTMSSMTSDRSNFRFVPGTAVQYSHVPGTAVVWLNIGQCMNCYRVENKYCLILDISTYVVHYL